VKSGLSFRKVWQDEDVVELEIASRGDAFLSCVQVYADHQHLNDVVLGLNGFKKDVHHGVFEISFGQFTPEYANGAFRAQLSFLELGRGYVFMTVNSQSAWADFAKRKVANQATLHLKSEPALLDRFIEELTKLTAGDSDEAFLEVV
jgi:hypothetical protein